MFSICFKALGIEDEEDMYKLADFFIKYKQKDLKEVKQSL